MNLVSLVVQPNSSARVNPLYMMGSKCFFLAFPWGWRADDVSHHLHQVSWVVLDIVNLVECLKQTLRNN